MPHADSVVRSRSEPCANSHSYRRSRTDDDSDLHAGKDSGSDLQAGKFDGIRAALLEIESRKDGGLDVKFMEPGTDVKKFRAIQGTARK